MHPLTWETRPQKCTWLFSSTIMSITACAILEFISTSMTANGAVRYDVRATMTS
jgi:hypothetical protein